MVIDVKCILSVVAMVPLQCAINGLDDYYFVIEKIGLDVVDVYKDAEEDELKYAVRCIQKILLLA